MIHYFTNRECAARLDLNLARWKRWSRSFLPPDPLGGLQSGYARQYTFRDLFKVFFGGHLLSHLKLSIADSQQILTDLTPWMKKAGFFELNGTARAEALDALKRAPYIIYFLRKPILNGKTDSHFSYLIQQIVSRQSSLEASGRQTIETKRSTFIDSQADREEELLQDPEVYLINLTALYVRLVDRLTHAR